MAATSWGVNHPMAQKLWSRKLFQDALKSCYFSKFMGNGTDSLIQVKTETSKDAGDKITYGLRMQLSGAGVAGDDVLEGSEESLIVHSDSLFIDQLRNAVVTGGRMSEQRVPFSTRSEAKDGLADWISDRMDTALFNQLAGITTQTDTRYTGSNATVAPTTIIASGCTTKDETTSLSAGASHILTLGDIDRAVAVAKTRSPTMRPINVPGVGKYFVLFIHPDVTYRLRSNFGTGQWGDVEKSKLMGGAIKDNPIVTGADFLGMYNGVLIYESTRVPNPISSLANYTQYRRSILCGAQAAAVGFGQASSDQKMTWDEESFDYGNKLGVSAGLIWGAKKTVFNSADFASIVLTSWTGTV